MHTFIYENIARTMEHRIRNGDYAQGERLPTDSDQAQEFSVSQLTVRKAMLVLQEKGLIVRQRGRGSFVTGGSEVVPLNVLYVGQLDGHFHRDLVLGLQREAQDMSTRVHAVAPGKAQGQELLQQLTPYLSDIDAVIVNTDDAHGVVQSLLDSGRRVLTTGSHVTPEHGLGIRVAFDPIAGLEICLGHLLRLGHRHIGLVTRGEKNDDPDAIIEAGARYNGAHRRFTGRIAENNDIRLSAYGTYADDEDWSVRSLCRLLEQPDRPTALVCDLDFRAVTVYRAAAEVGISIPNELSVTGVGNTPWAETLHPRLCSADMDIKHAVPLMLSLCNTASIPDGLAVSVQPKFVEGRSTQPLAR